jgi:hypothetical protein
VADLIELARRRRAQAPPPWVIWDALADPLDAGIRPWFDLAPGEVAPTILSGDRPTSLVWSSIWLDAPDLQVRFEMVPDGPGSMVTLVLWGPVGLDREDIERRRYRLSQLVNGQLRDSFDA